METTDPFAELSIYELTQIFKNENSRCDADCRACGRACCLVASSRAVGLSRRRPERRVAADAGATLVVIANLLRLFSRTRRATPLQIADKPKHPGGCQTSGNHRPLTPERRERYAGKEQQRHTAAEQVQHHKKEDPAARVCFAFNIGFHFCSVYSAQQDSFVGSLKREIATIFSASAIVG